MLIIICQLIIITMLSMILYRLYPIYYLRYLIQSYQNNNQTRLIIICNLDGDLKFYHIYNHIFNLMLSQYIYNINDDNLITNINNNKKNKLSLIVDSYGGDIINNDILIDMINGQINTESYILDKAMSAATLIVLSTNKIYMYKHAVLGPTDPQITLSNNEIYSVKSLIDLCENKSKDSISDEYLINYYDNKKLYTENKITTKKLLNKHYKQNISDIKKNNILDKLTNGDISHHTTLHYNYLSKYIKINTNISTEIKQIYSYYSRSKTY
jgi:ClpP class serine protease